MLTLTDVRKRIKTGKAMLFCGAGFSINCLNLMDSPPLLAKDLAKAICKIGNIPEDEDLQYVSDFFIEKKADKIDELISFLTSTYTIKKTDPAVENICKHNWRRIYTTNFDDTIETGFNNVGKICNSVSLDDDVKIYSKENNICLHINGYIKNLNRQNINTEFKLTYSSYVSPTSFEKSSWYYCFKKDLDNSNAIIFIGYSVYDIEIAKILFEGKYKEKTIFIVSENENDKNIYRLKKYGEVYSIGLRGFSEYLGEFSQQDMDFVSEHFQYFTQYEMKNPESNIRDTDIENFIMHGKLSSCYFDDYFLGNSERPYLIERNSFFEEALTQIKQGNNLIFYSDFGNGKSVLLNQLMSRLSIDGNTVLYPADLGGNYCQDIDMISKKKEVHIIVLDNYSRYIDMLEYIGHINTDNIQLILSDRTNTNRHYFTYLEGLSKECYSYNIDIIDSESELADVANIIDSLAFWSEKTNWSADRKINYLKNTCHSQFSNILIKIFDSEQMKDKLRDIIAPLFKNDLYKKNILGICLLETMNFSLKESLISELVQNNEIYNPKLTNSDSFKNLFYADRYGIHSKSSIFSASILRNHFTPSYIIENLLDIVEDFNLKRMNGKDEEEIFKYLLRFSFIESILPENNKRNSILRYYDELKVRVEWLKKDPHYWLQYGMSELMYSNFSKAQQYFDVGYELIKKKHNYDSNYLDTQQARLYLMRSLKETDGKIIFDYFIKGHDLLINKENDSYKYRQVLMYQEIYERKFESLPKNRKEDFIVACNKMINFIETIQSFRIHIHNSDNLKEKCINMLKAIVQKT